MPNRRFHSTYVQDSMGNRITMTLNTLGHITTLRDPDLGNWIFTYLPNGQVRTRRDDKGQTITYYYDRRSRMTSKSYSNREPSAGYTYDAATNGKGRLASATKAGVATTVKRGS